MTATSAAALFADAARQHRAGRLAEAEALYRRILAAAPRHADSLHLLGVIAHQAGQHGAAAGPIGQAIALDAGVAEFHVNLGGVFGALGQPEQAAACLRRALALRPDLAEAHSSLGYALAQLGELAAAAESCRRALAIRPDFAKARYNLAAALVELGRPEEAVASCRQAVAAWPGDADAHNALASALRQIGQLDEAARCSRQAIALRPDYAEAHFNLAMSLLAAGDMAQGWAEYEWRWGTPELRPARRAFVQPQWRGEAAPGRTLLIHAEQGFGETLQFCRYALLAAARGLRVMLQVPQPLVRLLASLPGGPRVIGEGEAVPAFDLHCPMLSLPLALGTMLASVPAATCYLRADPALAAAWGGRLAAMGRPGRRVGLCWAGNPRPHAPPSAAALDRRRSIAPHLLAPLLAVPGLHLVSLQKGGPAAPAEWGLTDPMPAMADFADTAALIANLDLVVSVDTAVAHLAAALGKPVWLLDRSDACWRWLAGRRDSPWYPTLRIYRQQRAGDWLSVVAEVAGDLRG